MTIASILPANATLLSDSPNLRSTNAFGEDREAGGVAAALGTTATTFHTNSVEAADRRRELTRRMWRRQRTMWAITDVKRLAGCHRWRASVASSVTLEWSSDGSVRWSGLQRSHSVWASPVSAVAIARQRIREATAAVESWAKDQPEGAYLLVTGTLAHERGQALAVLMDALQACWTCMAGGSGWVTDRRRYGIVHWHKQVEATVGPNGWHPHHHALMFLERPLSETELEALRARLYERHARAAVKAGLKRPTPQRGIRLDQVTDLEDARRMATYVAKGPTEGWDPAAEVAGGAFKDAKGDNRTQWQLLDSIADARDACTAYGRDLALWREWEETTAGRRQSSWSKGAKDALRVEVIADEDVDTADLVEEETTEKPVERYVIASVGQAWAELSDDTDRRLEVAEYVHGAKNPEEAQRRAHRILTTLGIGHESLCLWMGDDGGDLPTHRQALVRDLRKALT